MKIFLSEFITGGGFAGSPLPKRLAHEGDLMLGSVIRDFVDAGFDQIITTRDSRLAPLPFEIDARVIDKGAWDVWKDILRSVDAALIIAPETDAILYRLTVLAESCHCRVLGCDSTSIAVTASKTICIDRLAAQGIAVPRHYLPGRLPSVIQKPLILKPDDGVGGEDCYRYESLELLLSRLHNTPDGSHMLVQDWVDGQAASMTLLCSGNQVHILAVNRQVIEFKDNLCEFSGVIVNELADRRTELSLLAERIVQAIPGLNGIIGVDFVWSVDGPVVLEINPRLTTAYAGLRESLGYNPVEFLFRTQQNQNSGNTCHMPLKPVTVQL